MIGSTAETARKRPERPWTVARTVEVLRRCPLDIAQRLVHCATAVSTAVLGQSHKDNVRCTAVDATEGRGKGICKLTAHDRVTVRSKTDLCVMIREGDLVVEVDEVVRNETFQQTAALLALVSHRHTHQTASKTSVS